MKRLLFTAILSLVLFSCGEEQAIDKDKLQVMVSIDPQAFLVERIGSDEVQVHTMVKPGQSPELYEPAPGQILLFADISLYLTLGIPSEQVWIPSVRESFPKMSVFDITEGIERLSTPDYHDHKHAHNTGKDSHVWTSPRLMQHMAKKVLDQLSSFRPESRPMFVSNFLLLNQELEQLHREVSAMDLQGRYLLVYHPAWTYFCRDYGLEQLMVEVEGKEPSPREVDAIREEIHGHEIHTLFVQPHELNPTVRTIAGQVGLDIRLIDSLSRDYVSNLRAVAGFIQKGTGKHDD